MESWRAFRISITILASVGMTTPCFSESHAQNPQAKNDITWYMINTANSSKEKCLLLDFAGDPRGEVLKNYRKEQVDFYPKTFKDKSTFLNMIIQTPTGIVSMSFATTKERCEASYHQAVSAAMLSRNIARDFPVSQKGKPDVGTEAKHDDVQNHVEEDHPNTAYINKLRSGYSKRLKYVTPFAKSVIQSFYIDCQANDGRHLPLENLLLAKLASLDEKNAWLVIRADSRGDEVRIYDDLVGSNGKVMNSTLAFELNKWGDIRSMNGKIEAVINSCFFGYGPIWVTPRK